MIISISLVGIIVNIYSLGKKFYCTYLKQTTEHELILPYAKPFVEKMCKQFVKIWKKEKTCEQFLSTFNR